MVFPSLSNRHVGFQSPGLSPNSLTTTASPRLMTQVKDILKNKTSSTMNATRFRLSSSSHSSLSSTLTAPPSKTAKNRKRTKKTKSLRDTHTRHVYSQSSSDEENIDDDLEGENSHNESSEDDDDIDQEDTSECDDDDDDMDNYMDKDTTMSIRINAESIENKLAYLREKYPSTSCKTLLQALHGNDGHVTKTVLQLADSDSTPKKRPSTKKRSRNNCLDDQQPRQRQRQQRLETMHWKERQRLVDSAQTVRFFNTATPQEIVDVTSCNLTQAKKLITLRPFDHLQDLSNKLKAQAGLSKSWVKVYMDVMRGYSTLDYIIQSIEKTGNKLGPILNIWGSASITAKDQDEAGIHLTEVDIDGHNGLDTSSALYKEAMDGFLTEQPAIVNPEFNLKPYQLIGVNWLLLLYRNKISGILADEMGLGKTAQVICFLGRLKELGESGPHMIVVPASTLDNWINEFERFCPGLDVYCYYGSQADREEFQANSVGQRHKIDVVVTTYSMVSGSADDRSFLKELKCKSLILDEGHMVKNYTSARYGHLKQLETPFRLLLTGTPLQNNLQELVSLLIFIMPKMFTGFEDEVRKIFKLAPSSSVNTKGGSHQTHSSTKVTQLLSQQRINRAKKMMTPFVLRRRKAQVLIHLPKKIHHVEHCTMTPRQQAVYTDLVSTYQEQCNTLDDDKKDRNRLNNIVTQLRKAADHPLLFRYIYTDDTIKTMAKEIMKEECFADSVENFIYEDMEVMSDFELDLLCKRYKSVEHHKLTNEEWMDAGKVRFLQRHLPEMKRQGNKILLFSQFTLVLDILEPVMNTLDLSFIRLDGSTKVDDRQDLIDTFNQDPSITVFLLSTKAGGFGINLTSANVVVMYDVDFNPQNDKQAEDRAHRVGQTRDVNVYKLISEHTIEHQILDMANIRLRLDSTVSENTDDRDVNPANIKSLLKSALLPSA